MTRWISAAISVVALAACGWNPARPFDREAPAVTQSIADLDAGDAAAAAARLESYLSTGACKEGSIGIPDAVKRRADGTFDLGLALFRVGEQFGRRFGDEEATGPRNEDPQARSKRREQVDCALRVVQAVAADDSNGPEFRARARYLEGNLSFLDGEYEDAVAAYDKALHIAPAEADGGDPVARDAAWNRAIALRRIDDKKDAGQDASDTGPPEAGGDAAADGGQNRPNDAGQDAAGAGNDAAAESNKDAAAPPPPERDAGPQTPEAAAPPPSSNEDERMLDQLENAPTVQQEEARHAGKRRVRGIADK
jgi:hypothetical protein